VPFDDAWLREVYGDNDIGGRTLYDPGRAWFGCALSAFGIVYNAEGLRRLGLAAPRDWSALADPRLRGEVALANPAQSGSIASGMETILQREGWQLGWAILRRAAANARSVSASATRAPIDVAQGQAVEALCIDFYGRFQQQSVTDGGSPGRVGYVDPVGKTAVDPDPVAMLRGAPHAETARRFIEFALSVEGQRLWQYRPGTEGGPRWTGLRRLPARRSLYATEMSHFTDKVDPWLLATAIANPNPDFRAFVAPLFVAMAIDNRSLLREAWACIAAHPEYPQDGRVRRGAVRQHRGQEQALRLVRVQERAALAVGPELQRGGGASLIPWPQRDRIAAQCASRPNPAFLSSHQRDAAAGTAAALPESSSGEEREEMSSRFAIRSVIVY
jgi:hypothetical protein